MEVVESADFSFSTTSIVPLRRGDMFVWKTWTVGCACGYREARPHKAVRGCGFTVSLDRAGTERDTCPSMLDDAFFATSRAMLCETSHRNVVEDLE